MENNEFDLLETERTVLGSCFSDKNSLLNVTSSLNDSHFFYNPHIAILNAIKDIVNKECKFNSTNVWLTLNKNFKDKDQEDFKNTEAELGVITGKYSYFYSTDEVEKLIDKKISSDTTSLLLKYAGELNEKCDVNHVLSKIKKSISDVENNSCKAEEAFSLDDFLTGDMCHYEHANEIRQNRIKYGDDYIPGLKTGFKKLDKLIGGLGLGHLVILGARTGVGKSTLGFNIAGNLSIKEKIPGLIFSLEMGYQETFAKITYPFLNLDYKKYKNGLETKLDDLNEEKIKEQLKEAKFFIVKKKKPTIDQVVSSIRAYKNKHDIQYVLVDYLQKIEPSKNLSQRHLELEEVSSKLKLIADELNISVVCLAQLSRKAASGDNKRPKISDLRESGSIEQDADTIILMDRPEAIGGLDSGASGKSVLHIDKNRHGEQGNIDICQSKENGEILEYDSTVNEDINDIINNLWHNL